MKKLTFALLTLTLLLVFPTFGQAIGQITEPIVVPEGIRGQEIVSTLTLLNSEKKQTMIGIVAEGQIASWVSFYKKDDPEFKNPITEVFIEAGQYLDVAALFKIPSDAANGTYTGEISVVYNPDQATSKNDDSSSTVAQKISRAVEITVSDKEVIALDVSVIPEKFDFKTKEPISVRIIYDNQSNISLTPSIQFKIKQDEKTVYNVIYPYPEGEASVRSMSLHEIPALKISTDGLSKGAYLAELTFMRGAESMAVKNFSFSIGNSGIVLGAMFTKNNLVKTIIGILILIVLIAIIVVSLKRKAQKNSNN